MQSSYYLGDKKFKIAPQQVVELGHDDVQLQVSHCGVCGTDVHIYHGAMDARVNIPQPIGHEMSGIVVKMGENVKNVELGDRVVVRPLKSCGDCPACLAGHNHICQNLDFLGIDTPGAMQQTWQVPANTLHKLPDSVSFEHGAMIEPLAVAVHDVRRGRVKKDDYCVVIGGGPIGLLIGLVAKQKGARVLISEVNAFRLDLAKSLGLDVINPLEQDLLNYVETATNNAGADVVFEVSGTAIGAKTMTELPRTRGRIVMVAIHANAPQIDMFRFFWRELELVGARVYEAIDFDEAIQLALEKKIPFDAIITEVKPLDQIQEIFDGMDGNPNSMKSLIQCNMENQG